MTTKLPPPLPDEALAKRIMHAVNSMQSFSLNVLYELFPEEKKTTIRGRVYRELLGTGMIKKEGKGVYSFVGENGSHGAILHGDARELKALNSESIDLIIADHPYEIAEGRGRCFNEGYKDSTFYYKLEDFQEKMRVLKEGHFLVEFLPEMKQTNFRYLMEILNNADKAGFNLYAKVPWYKAEMRDGKIVDHSAFVGRKAVMEEVYVFSKGRPRQLRERNQGGTMRMESGAASMLPAIFMEAPIQPTKRVHKAQKPESLIRRLIEAFSLEGETVLDQFAGSFVTFFTALKMQRQAIAIEVNSDFIQQAIGEL